MAERKDPGHEPGTSGQESSSPDSQPLLADDANLVTGVAHLLSIREQPVVVNDDSLTGLLQEFAAGVGGSSDRLMPMVYGELRKIASSLMARERPSTLQPTALVHEAFLRLLEQNRVVYQDRGHFFAIAARIMRRVVVDYARSRGSWKRGGRQQFVPLNEALDAFDQRCSAYLRLDDALEDLAKTAPQRAAIIELRAFGGFTLEETAEALGISRPTVNRQYKMAKAWLHHHLGGPL